MAALVASRPALREIVFVAAAALLSAYLMFVNLDYVALWHDEATNAWMAASLARDGSFSGWDGRNLLFGTQLVDQGQFAIDNDLRLAAYPPWPALSSALGLLLFGGGEFALRFPHALLGALCLPVLYGVLRLNFPAHPRLRMLAFAMFALSPIVILYARQGRYYPDALLFTLLSLYCYQRFWRGDGARWLCGLCIFTLLNFLNHFGIGFVFAASLALWHVLFFRRETSARMWMLFAAAAGAAAAACFGYFLWAGIVGGDSALEYGGSYKYSWLHRKALHLFFYLRDTVRTGWLPLWIAAWWLWHAAMFFITPSPLPARRRGRQKNRAAEEYQHRRALLRFAALSLLILVFTALTAVTPAANHQLADMRYLLPALPFFILMSAACADWLWAKNAAAGAALTALLIFSNFAGFPFLVQGALCSGDLFANNYAASRLPLAALAREVHSARPSASAEVAEYLRAHARQDDTIFVDTWPDYALLMHYLSDKMIFCCGLPADAALPRDKIRALGAPVFREDGPPDWIVRIYAEEAPPGYRLAYAGRTTSYPVHRPELEFHCFEESSLPWRARIFRRIKS